MLEGWHGQPPQQRLVLAIATGAALITLLMAGTAAADKEFKDPTSPVARKHRDTGNRYYKLQKFKEAIAEYKAGALVEDLPIFLYNLGQSYRQLGEYANAIWYYKRYLSQGTPSKQRKAWVKDVIQDMNKELQRAARTKPPTGPGPGGTVPPPIKVTKPAPATNQTPWYKDTLGWSITGAGMVSLGLGGGLFLNASDLDDQADSENDQDERDALREHADTRRTIGTLSSIAGAALIVGGLIKLIRNPQPERAKASASTGVSIAVGKRWVGLIGRF